MAEPAVALALFTVGTGGVSSLMSMLTYQQAQYSAANRGIITALLLAACEFGMVDGGVRTWR